MSATNHEEVVVARRSIRLNNSIANATERIARSPHGWQRLSEMQRGQPRATSLVHLGRPVELAAHHVTRRPGWFMARGAQSASSQ
jgi:hypothetical protein